jgi:glycosyltransferase involved in cell wall biosynthesis
MRLIVFFTYNISLQDWKKTGVISRELNFYSQLAKKGLKITFITYGDASDLKIKLKKNLDVIPIFTIIKKTKFNLLNLILSLISIFYLKKKLSKYDLIKTHQIYGSWLALLTKYIIKKPMVLRGGYEPISFEKKSIKFFFVFFISYLSYILSDIILLSNKLDIKYVSKLFFVKSQKIHYFPNSVNIKNFFIKEKIKKRKKNFVYVGRLTEQKNLFEIFRIIKLLNDSLDIYGNGPMKKELIFYAKKNKINVNFYKNVENNKLVNIYNKYKFCILLSRYEGSPKVMLEAMACGCVMIVSKAKGIVDIIKQNKNGFYIGSNVNYLKKLIKDINLQNQISTNAFNLIKKKYNYLKFIQKEFTIYKKLI